MRRVKGAGGLARAGGGRRGGGSGHWAARGGIRSRKKDSTYSDYQKTFLAIGLELAIILSTNQPLLPLIAKMTEKANEAVLFFIIRDFDRGGHARSTKTLFGDSIPWGEDFSMRSNSIVAVLVVFFGTILWALVKDTYLSIALEEVTQRAADYLRIPKADMIASATPYVLSIGVVTVAAIAAFKLGERERKSFQAAPNIDPRLAFQRILQHRSWLKRNAENDPEKRKRLTTDYLEIRLDEQMHAALAQDKIFAW